ncbi:MAG: hypothetical protein EOO53_12390 [Gammaproteobacteria bacterium]|nr:MAG: hypothetical protein EOO53_12390 [Gammaproteobacteria bacterium]
MKKHTAHLLCAAASTLIFSTQSVSASQTITEALQTGSTIKLNFRTRYENVEWDGYEDADAFTLRSRLSYQSGAWNGFALTAEVDNVTAIDHDVDYATWGADPIIVNGKKAAPIFDPEGTDLNQALISYSTFNNQIKYGRQRITLDNSRFIGNVGWRQNEQTYDGISLTNKSIRYTNIFAAHITNVNRVFGNAIPVQGDYKQDTNLLNVSYTGFEAGKLTGYAYLIDNLDDATLVGTGAAANKSAAISSDTYGVRWASTANPAFMYALEYAQQKGAGSNPLDYKANYIFAEASTTLGRFVPAVGYEVLGSDKGTKGFATPFATLHIFNGWADRFLATPKEGVKDVYASLTANVWGAQFVAAYHKYDADEKSLAAGPTFGKKIDFGSEWDLSVSKKIGAVVYLAKYATFDNGDWIQKIGTQSLVSDTTKFWLQADWNF